jgi:hypothetical protein
MKNTPTDAEIAAYWDKQIAAWKAGLRDHPLAQHPLAVPCKGHPGCFTVAPVRIYPSGKTYCCEHAPAEDRN